MRAAPTVDYPVEQSGLWRCAAAALGGGAAAVLAAWLQLWLTEDISWWMQAVPVVAAVGGAMLGWRTTRAQPAVLRWTGKQWQLLKTDDDAEALAGYVQPVIDIGAWMLLLWFAADGAADRHTAWLSFARKDAPQRWHRLRVAVFEDAALSGRLNGKPRSGNPLP